ncbi:hypothetical protein ABZ471_05570 [Streptomyces sp. NPDC005728]
MSLLRDDGIEPRTQKPGEADRIVPCCPGGRPSDPRPAGSGGRL